MEIESKFRIPNSTLFEQLRESTQSRGYHFIEPQTKTITDTYVDTASHNIRSAGFACRLRHNTTQNTWVAALKGMGGAEGAVHSRIEYEVEIEPNAQPADWPASKARDLAMQYSKGEPLTPILTIQQTRHVRNLEFGGRPVGELSLDEVTYIVNGSEHRIYELEIELGASGTLDDLHALHSSLMPVGLIPEPLSKFEQGLALMGVKRKP